jgi:hypothetical protein
VKALLIVYTPFFLRTLSTRASRPRGVVCGVRALLLAPLAYGLVQLAFTPLLRALGLYRYHSAMLKATIRTRTYYELHAGTAFDYLTLFRWCERGAPARRRIVVSFLEGLLDVARLVETGELSPSIHIAATSYFFREASVERLGFELRPPRFRPTLAMAVSSFELALLYSFARGRPAFPPIWRAREAVIGGADLLSHRNSIRQMLAVLAAREMRMAQRTAPASFKPVVPARIRRMQAIWRRWGGSFRTKRSKTSEPATETPVQTA